VLFARLKVWHSLTLALALLLSNAAGAQAVINPAPATATPAVVGSANASPKGKWKELTLAQQQALEPLAPHWSSLSEGQKKNGSPFPKISLICRIMKNPHCTAEWPNGPPSPHSNAFKPA